MHYEENKESSGILRKEEVRGTRKMCNMREIRNSQKSSGTPVRRMNEELGKICNIRKIMNPQESSGILRKEEE